MSESRPTPASEPDGLPRIQHDLRNFLTALRSGCALVHRHLAAGEISAVEDLVSQMRREVDGAFAIVERLRSVE